MPSIQLISGARVGASSTAVGAPNVSTRLAIYPSGAYGGVVSTRFGVWAANVVLRVDFNFTAFKIPSFNFEFGGAGSPQPLFSHTYSQSGVVSHPLVSNAAQDVRPTGLDRRIRVGPLLVFDPVNYYPLVFNKVVQADGNLTWGSTQVIYPTPFDEFISGEVVLKTQQRVQPVGASGAVVGGGVVYHDHDLANATLRFEQLPATDLNFVFGAGDQPLFIKPSSTGEGVGSPTVENTAQGVFTEGVPQRTAYGFNLLYRSTDTGVVYLDFVQSFTALSGANIAFTFSPTGNILVGGIAPPDVGVPTLQTSEQRVSISGVAPPGIGAVAVRHVRKLYPTPVYRQLLTGTARVSKNPQVFYPDLDRTGAQWGVSWVSLPQIVYHNEPSEYVAKIGSAWVSKDRRTLLVDSVAADSAYGSAWVSAARRTVAALPQGAGAVFGVGWAAQGQQVVRTQDGGHLGFGNATLLTPSGQGVLVPSIVRQVVPSATVVKLAGEQTMLVESADSLTFGVGALYNKLQFVAPVPTNVRLFEDERFGNRVALFLQFKTIAPAGFNAARYGNAEALLGKPPLRPVGDDFSVFGVSSVTNWQQEVAPTGFEKEPRVEAHRVYLGLTKISLDGWGRRDSVFGFPKLSSNTQWVLGLGRAMGGAGFHWASYYRREVRPEGVAPLEGATPWVTLYERTIAPVGWSSYVGASMGDTTLHIYKAMLKAKGGQQVIQWGEARVRNVTPEIAVPGFSGHEVSKPVLHLLKRFIYPDPAKLPAIPSKKSWLSERNRLVLPQSVLPASGVGVPLVTDERLQFLWDTRPRTLLVGEGGENAKCGDHTLTTKNNRLLVFNEVVGHERFGDVFVRLNTIEVSPYSQTMPFGWAQVLGGAGYSIRVRSVGGMIEVGRPSLRHLTGPQYLYPVFPFVDWQYHIPEPASWSHRFGTELYTQLLNRQVRPFGIGAPGNQVPMPRLPEEKPPPYIYPIGIRSYRSGIDTVVFTPGPKKIYVQGSSLLGFGSVALSVPIVIGVQTLYASGAPGEKDRVKNGTPRLEKQHREVFMHGTDHTVVNRPGYVGDYLRIYPEGFETRPEYVEPPFGFETFIDFSVRTITQIPNVDGKEFPRHVVKRPFKVVYPRGVECLEAGVPFVKTEWSEIRATGIRWPYGAMPAPYVSRR